MKCHSPKNAHHHTSRKALFVGTGLALAVILASASGALAESAAAEAASELKKLSLEQLMDMEVTTASKRPERMSEVPAAIEVITGEEIRRSGASSIPEALRLASNLQVAQVNSHEWAISARGFNDTTANKLLVLIDGRSAYTPLFAGVFWDVQDQLLEDVERIEVISGPGGTLWGANAVNGIINIITKTAKDTPGLYLEGGAGSDLRGFGGLRYGGQLRPDVHFRLFGKYFDRDSTVLPDGRDATNAWHMGQGGFRVDWDATNNNLLTLQGDLYDGRIDQADRNETVVTGGNLLGRWTHTFSEDSDLQLQAYYDRTRRRIPDLFSEDLDTYDVDLNYRFPVGWRQNIAFGLGYRLIDDEVENSTVLAFLPAEKTFQIFSAFLQDEIIVVEDRLRLTLGSKFEHNDYTDFEFQPSGRLTWTPTERQTLWGAISRGVRTPSRIDRDFSAVTPVLDLRRGTNFVSEELLAYELGYRVQPYPKLSLSVAAFYNDYDHVRSLRPLATNALPSVLTIANDVEGHTKGVELSATYQLTDWWRLRGGYTFLEKDADLMEGNDPEQHFLLRSSMNFPHRWEFDATVRYMDTLPAPHVPNYIEMDLRLGWSPIKDLELAVVSQNLLDSQHPEFGMAGARQEIERSVYGKISWRF